MNIDERLDRLAGRHEALAQSVEMLRDSIFESARKAEADHDGFKADHDRFMADMAEMRASNEADHAKFRMELADLRDSVRSLAESTAKLVTVSNAHESRFGRIESAA